MGPSHVSLPFFNELTIKVLQDVEGLLPFTATRDQSFTVIEILYARQRSARRAKISQDPRSHAAERRNLLQHPELMLIQILLVLLGPSHARVTVIAEKRV